MKIIELFSGIGAWSKALDRLQIDYEIVEAIELDKKTMDSYNILHNTNFEARDITEIDPNNIPDCDIIFYSPPCQSFSAAGKQLGFEETRGTLFFDAMRIIQAKKPKYAVMENVKGLTQKKFQFEFETMLQLLEQEGYKNYWKVLNSKDYGIPENRERVYIVSIREDIEQNYKFPEPVKLKTKLLDYLEEDAELPILHNIYGGFKEKKPRIFTEYAPTIRTARGGGHIPSVCTNDPNKTEKIIDGYNTRKLTPRECLRLMGFSDEDYELLNKLNKNTQIYKMAGNSIVVDTLEFLLGELFKGMKNSENKLTHTPLYT